MKASSDQRRSAEPGRSGRGKGPIRARPTASTTQVFRCCLRPAPDKSSDRPPEERTSFRTPSLEGQEEAAWSARWTTNGEEAHHVGGFARGVLAHCEAWNLSGQSVAAEAAPSGRRWWFALTLVAAPPSESLYRRRSCDSIWPELGPIAPWLSAYRALALTAHKDDALGGARYRRVIFEAYQVAPSLRIFASPALDYSPPTAASGSNTE